MLLVLNMLGFSIYQCYEYASSSKYARIEYTFPEIKEKMFLRKY